MPTKEVWRWRREEFEHRPHLAILRSRAAFETKVVNDDGSVHTVVGDERIALLDAWRVSYGEFFEGLKHLVM